LIRCSTSSKASKSQSEIATVNTAARIQAQAGAGELALSDELYSTIADLCPEAERRVLMVRGKEKPLTLRVIRPGEG
jgi:class 3 adenylate cyclase